MAGGCKKQLITVAEEGVRKQNRCNNQAEQEKEGRKWQEFSKIVWDTIHGQITDRMQELNSYIDQDVNPSLRGVCDLFRVDVGNQFTRFNERRKQLSEQWIESVANAAEDRVVKK